MNRLDQSYDAAGIEQESQLANSDAFRLRHYEKIEYQIKQTDQIFSPENETISAALIDRAAFCLIDSNVQSIYGAEIGAYFRTKNIPARFFSLESGESNKNMQNVLSFAEFCFDNKISRRDVIVCIGGGIICDIGGFAANLIRRGTPCLKIPTTLIGVVDAAVGVKTGVNFKEMKNSLGTYSEPTAVYYDLEFLHSLPIEHIRNGLAEIVKILALKDFNDWELLEKVGQKFFDDPQDSDVVSLIQKSILYMLEELRPNLREKNLRRIVDYGHEFGHAIEVITDFTILHGEAVAIGMAISNAIALHRSEMGGRDFLRFIEFYEQVGLPCYDGKIDSGSLMQALESNVRHKHGDSSIVAIKTFGEPIFLDNVKADEVHQAWLYLSNL